MADTDTDTTPAPAPENEIKITFIGGAIHKWTYFPGSWDPYAPKPGDLLRVWVDPAEKPPRPQ